MKLRTAVIGNRIEFRENSLSRLRELGSVEVHNIVPTPEALIRCGSNSDIIISWGTPTKDVVQACSKLKLYSYLHTGHDKISSNLELLNSLNSQGIAVTYTPGFATQSCAEFALATVLMLKRCLLDAINAKRKNPSTTFEIFNGTDFNGSCIGILGFGQIGQATAAMCHTLGARVAVSTRTPPSLDFGFPFRMVELEELFTSCSAIVIACSLTESSVGLVDRHLLRLLPNNSVVVNVSRAEVFKLEDLLPALNDRPDLRVAIDSFSSGDNESLEMLSHPGLFISPHLAAVTPEALLRCTDVATQNILDWLKGENSHRVPGNVTGSTVCDKI